MIGSSVRVVIVVGAGVLWYLGLRLFVRSPLSRARKVGWSVCLALVGGGIGVVLPFDQLWSRFCLLIVVLPALGLADVWLLRSGRGLSFWIRACGFEVCTVFGVAAAARLLLDLAGVAAVVPGGR